MKDEGSLQQQVCHFEQLSVLLVLSVWGNEETGTTEETVFMTVPSRETENVVHVLVTHKIIY